MLLIAAVPNSTICLSQCTTVTATVTGGTPAYTITWNPGNLNGTTVTLCPTVTTTYTITATDANGCAAQNQTFTITVNPGITAVSSNPVAICVGASTILTASATGGNGGPYNYVWMPGNGTGTSYTVSPTTTTTYSVIVTDNCGTPADTATVTVTVNPLPVISIIADDSAGCAPHCVNFTNLTPNTSTISWSFGDGGNSTSLTPGTYCYLTPGSYDVFVTVTDINGCVNSATAVGMINVYPVPVADFTMSPQPTTILNPIICFTDLSIGASQWSWDFGNPSDLNNTSTLQNPCHTYGDTGRFCVTLTALNSFGCWDTTTYCLIIDPDFTLYVPNAFTPNGDGNNEVFVPEGIGMDKNEYVLYIFDRWGNLIWQTDTWGKGWDGRANGGSEIAQEDVYVWKIVCKDIFGKQHQYVGHVSIIK